ncbi:MAG: family 1 glycosylhydrolase, partial [Vicinamibacteria bacterium]
YVGDGRLPSSEPAWIRPGDLATIAVPLDFLGVNFYTRRVARSTSIPEAKNAAPTVLLAPESERTTMGWEVCPEEFYRLLCRIHFEYRPPRMYVTENGAAFVDSVSADGHVHDERRVAYLREHFAAAHAAIAAGVPLAGYFVWSFLDNFEWERGYSQRFGIVRVDYESQKRTPKDSALYLKQVIAANAVEAEIATPASER